jgi:hypothetical protein
MHYVILRDDDTCAFTPPACLERLYRPFLERGMPVNLAAIPEVRTDVRTVDGGLEGYLAAGSGPDVPFAPIAQNRGLVEYIRSEPRLSYRAARLPSRQLRVRRFQSARAGTALDRGANSLREAGFALPEAFVAPYDRLSREAFVEVAARFDVISTGWFEARRVPLRWWRGLRAEEAGAAAALAGGREIPAEPSRLPAFVFPAARGHDGIGPRGCRGRNAHRPRLPLVGVFPDGRPG